MSRTALVLVSAVVLGALAFALGPGTDAAIAAVAAAGFVGVALWRRPRGWGTRLAVGLLVAYLLAWGGARIDAWRTTRAAAGEASSALVRDKRHRAAEALEDRLAENRIRIERVVARLSDDEPLGPLEQDTELFVRLGRAVVAPLPPGIGIEVYDAEGSLRAWWGDPRGDRIPPDSVGLAVERTVVRRPAGFTIAHAAALWPASLDTFRVAVKDLWAVESPLGRDVAEEGLLLPRLEEREDLTLSVTPGEGDGTILRGAEGEPIATLEVERFLVDRFLAERRMETGRILILLLLWPLAWAGATVWHASRPSGGNASDRALALARRAAVLAALWALLVETRFLATILPASWFSPLAFAEISYGPAGRSPGDFLVATSLVALLALSAWSIVPRVGRREGRGIDGIGLAACALALGVGAASVVAAGPVLENALEGMSPQVFFSPTLLFSPPFLMVLLGFGLVAGVVVVGLAIGLRWAGVPSEAEWIAGAVTAVVVGIGFTARGLSSSAMAGTRAELAPWLGLALAGSALLVVAVGRTERRRGAGTPIRVGLMAMSLGALISLPLAAHARVQAAQDLLVERAERIGGASSQWVSYTIDRTVEFLARDPEVPRALESGNRDAALLLWSRSPLRELDFATGLFLLDSDGEIVSRFTLTAEDWSARARQMATAVSMSPIAVAGTQDERGIRWAVVPVYEGDERVGTAVAMTTESVELRDPAADASYLLTDLLRGSETFPDLLGYTILDPDAPAPPRTLMTAIRSPPGPDTGREETEPVVLAMPLDPLLPGARGWAVFVLVGALAGLVLSAIDRAMHERTRGRWWRELRRQNPLRSFRVQLLIAFLVIAAIPLTIAAVVGYRSTRTEIEESTRRTAAEALSSASRLLIDDEALERGTSEELGARLRELAGVLRQDLILYWRGRTVASSRPEIFSSRLFADRMEGSVYAELFAGRDPLVFDATTVADRSFLVAYRALSEPDPGAGYVLATPLLIREDRARVELERLGEGIFLLGALSLLFLVVVGWGLARFMARPLSALETGTRHIAAGHLSYRLPSPARRDEFGRVQRAFNAMVSRLETSQRELEREKSRVQAILASVGAGVVALDADGRVRLLNDRAAALLDHDPEEVVDRTIAELAEGGSVASVFWSEVARALETGGRCDRDLVLPGGEGERHYHVVCTGLRDATGIERGVVVAFEDITDNVESQRVLAWGEMARQVAHEIKNPLTPMKLSLQHLERLVEDRAPDFEDVFDQNLDLVLAEIDRLERIAGSFARFAVPEPTAPEPIQAVEIAADVVALYGSGDDGVEYGLEVVGDPVPVLADPEGFRRVIVNLVENAREAVQADGGSSVAVRLDFDGEGDRATISVIDDGVGLPEEGVERLFEPSFSTKTRGTGLGLAMARRIVESWGGSIEWERREPRGTAMHVTLRAVTEDAGA